MNNIYDYFTEEEIQEWEEETKYLEQEEKIEELLELFSNLDEDSRKFFIDTIIYYNQVGKDDNLTDLETMKEILSNKMDELEKKENFITSERIKSINEKELITVEEFEILYGRGKYSQDRYRTRKKNPLRTVSGKGKGIHSMYDRLECEKWVRRYLKPNR